MKDNVVAVDRFARYVREIRDLKSRNAALEEHNRDLARRLEGLHGEYLELRYAMKGMSSQAEVLLLRKKIFELQQELRLSGLKPQRH